MNNNEELINKDVKNTAELTGEELTNVVGGDTDGFEWPDYIVKAAGMFQNPDYDEEYICLQCSLMGLNFEEVRACAQDLGYL